MQEMTAIDDDPKLIPFPVYLAVKYGDNIYKDITISY